jgi:hypothetical protein
MYAIRTTKSLFVFVFLDTCQVLVLPSSFFAVVATRNPDGGCLVIFDGAVGLSNLSRITLCTIFVVSAQTSSANSSACLVL